MTHREAIGKIIIINKMVEMTREGFLVAHIAVERFRLGFYFSHRYFRRQKHEVAIIMGSNSDWPILEPAEKTLKEFGVEVEVIVASAHRTPDVYMNLLLAHAIAA